MLPEFKGQVHETRLSDCQLWYGVSRRRHHQEIIAIHEMGEPRSFQFCVKVDVGNVFLNDPDFVCEGIQHIPANEVDRIRMPQFGQMSDAESFPIGERPELLAWLLAAKQIIWRSNLNGSRWATFRFLITDVDAASHVIGDGRRVRCRLPNEPVSPGGERNDRHASWNCNITTKVTGLRPATLNTDLRRTATPRAPICYAARSWVTVDDVNPRNNTPHATLGNSN